MTAHDQAAALRRLPDAERSKLETALSAGPMIEAARAREITGGLGIGIEQLMIALLPVAAAHARIQISGFSVGAIARGSTGNLYLGSNMEFPSQSLTHSIHGEQSAVNNAWLSGEEGLDAVAVNELPCGYCRQFLNEVASSSDLRILLASKTEAAADFAHSSRQLAYYLPDSFGPSDLGVTEGLMDPQLNGLSDGSEDPLVQLALNAANASYAPYTHNFAGVALRTASDKTYAGRYAENAAFNPSMSPLQSALALLNMHEPAQAEYEVVAAVLVEAHGAQISQRSATEALLASIAPGVELDTKLIHR